MVKQGIIGRLQLVSMRFKEALEAGSLNVRALDSLEVLYAEREPAMMMWTREELFAKTPQEFGLTVALSHHEELLRSESIGRRMK